MAAASHPIALITGASSGIGEALAHVFAAHGHDLVLVSRNEQALDRVADEIGTASGQRPLVFSADLGRSDAGARIAHELMAKGVEPAYVVNNAGFGLTGRAAQLNRSEQLAMVDLNVRTLTDLSLRWVDSLRRHRGGILNVASVAGFFPGPRMAVYFATKAFVVSFSEALHHELARDGIRVTTVCPGPVPTGFQDRAGVDESRKPGGFVVSAQQVAKEAFAALANGRRIITPGLPNKAAVALSGVLPHSLILRAIDRRNRKRQRPPQPAWPRPQGGR